MFFVSLGRSKVQTQNEVSRVSAIDICTFRFCLSCKYKRKTKYQGVWPKVFVLFDFAHHESTNAKRNIKACGDHHLYFLYLTKIKVQTPDEVSTVSSVVFCTLSTAARQILLMFVKGYFKTVFVETIALQINLHIADFRKVLDNHIRSYL